MQVPSLCGNCPADQPPTYTFMRPFAHESHQRHPAASASSIASDDGAPTERRAPRSRARRLEHDLGAGAAAHPQQTAPAP
jgi:hypothetical protein